MRRMILVGLMIMFGTVGAARAQSRTEALWTVSGSGVGFGVGLWAGLTAFDDAVNSDRKVWTSAIVGAGVGAVAGYLVGRARTHRTRPSIARNEVDKVPRRQADQRLLEHLAKSFRFTAAVVGVTPGQAECGNRHTGSKCPEEQWSVWSPSGSSRRHSCGSKASSATEAFPACRRAFLYSAEQDDEQGHRDERRINPEKVTRDVGRIAE